MDSLDDAERHPRGHIDIQRLAFDEQLLREMGETSAADKFAAMRTAISDAWQVHARQDAARHREALASNEERQTTPTPPRLVTPQDEARALAPAYDYIRAVVTRWRAERAECKNSND